MTAPLISDATFAKCVRLVSTFAMPNEDRWSIVRELIAGRYAVALDVVRCDDRENANLIEALEEANEEAAREHDRREAEAEPIVQVPRSRPGPRPSREARRRPRARSCRGRAALRPLERPRRAPTEVLLKVGAAWIERLTKERDEARAERDGLRAELAAEKRGRP